MLPHATLNLRGNPQLLDWEVIESHAVAPVQVLFKEHGAYPTEPGG